MSNIIPFKPKAAPQPMKHKTCLGCGKILPKLFNQPLCPTCKVNNGPRI